MKKKIIAAVCAALCLVAVLVVCAIIFKPDEQGENPNDTETETQEPGYYEEEEVTFPELPL